MRNVERYLRDYETLMQEVEAKAAIARQAKSKQCAACELPDGVPQYVRASLEFRRLKSNSSQSLLKRPFLT